MKIILELTELDAQRAGLVICECGHRKIKHVEPAGKCTSCEKCTGYKEKIKWGKIIATIS